MSFISVTKDVLDGTAVAKWMQLSANSVAGAAAAWGAILTANTLSWAQRYAANQGQVLGGLGGVTGQSKALAAIQQILIEPNFMGVVLHTATETTNRDVDVSEEVVIVQDGYQQQYNLDNAVPRLKEWQYDCYVVSQSFLGLDTGLYIKPTLLVQLNLLDQMANSRQPGWLKDGNSTFHLVLITKLSVVREPQSMNAAHVQIAFKEYKPLQTESVGAKVYQMVLS